MKMRVKLEEVCERGSSNLKQSDVVQMTGDYPIYGASGYIGNVDFYHQEKPYVAVVKDGAGIGRITLHPAKSSVIGTMQYLLPKDNVLPEYLYYVVSYMHLEKYFTGATIPHIYFRDYKNEEFNLDSLDKQKEIVDVLGKCEVVIESRKQELQKLDVLIKARFVEMFGDVKINPHKYKKNSIKSVLKTCEAGWSGNGTQRIRKDDEIAVLKVSAVTKGYFIPEECKVLDDQENIKKYVTPEKGDLLFSRANTREMVGATAIVKEDYPSLILPDKLWKIKFRDNVNVFYMKYVLSSKSVRNQFSVVSTGTSGSMYNVSMDKFKAIEVPLPPIELQNQFADFVNQVDKSKVAVQKALDETQLLFDSLMQEYFG
jgi:type I restriction enzyme S subunit